MPTSSRLGSKRATPSKTGTLDLALRLLDYLAPRSQPTPLGLVAKDMSASKATIYRHLQALLEHDYVHQDVTSGHYEIGIKILILAEAARARFDIVRSAHDELVALRDATGQAATLCTMLQHSLVVLDLIQGLTIVEFNTRPGTRLDLNRSAHGKIWLAFGSPSAAARTDGTRGAKPAQLAAEIARVRRRGWATAPDAVIAGVNALAAPVFDHNGRIAGSIAIVGATQFIPAEPHRGQVEAVTKAAARISAGLGWKES